MAPEALNLAHLQLSRRAFWRSVAQTAAVSTLTVLAAPTKREEITKHHPHLSQAPEALRELAIYEGTRNSSAIIGGLNFWQQHLASIKASFKPSLIENFSPGITLLRDDKLKDSRQLSFQALPHMQLLNALAKAMIGAPILSTIAGPNISYDSADKLKSSASGNFALLMFIEVGLFIFSLSGKSKSLTHRLHFLHSHPTCILESLRSFRDTNNKTQALCFLTAANPHQNPSLFDYIPEEMRRNGNSINLTAISKQGKIAVGQLKYFNTSPSNKQAGFYQEIEGQWHLIDPHNLVQNSHELTISIA